MAKTKKYMLLAADDWYVAVRLEEDGSKTKLDEGHDEADAVKAILKDAKVSIKTCTYDGDPDDYYGWEERKLRGQTNIHN